MAKTDFLALLRALNEHRVDYIVVGGVAAVLHGAPVSTFDLDVVHSRQKENIARLVAVLRALDAYYRARPERRLTPDVSHLASPGHQLLATCFGPLDLLGEVGAGRRYEDLLPESIIVQAGEEVSVRVLNLETLIMLKERLAREKDRAVISVLRRTLEEKRRREEPSVSSQIGKSARH
jgi:hypothetical protein